MNFELQLGNANQIEMKWNVNEMGMKIKWK